MSPRRISVLRIAACCAIVVVTAMVLSPIFAPTDRGMAPKFDCQSNLAQIARALKMYMQDNHDAYPTNRCFLPNGKLGPISCYVKLTPADVTDKDGKSKRFRYGVNWVEALGIYMQRITQNSAGAWYCKAVCGCTYPERSKRAWVTYVFNRNLIEFPEGRVRNAANVTMVREMDRLVDAELRPINRSTDADTPPISPLLTTQDFRLGETKPDLHRSGSNIVFADYHVKYFHADYFPEQGDITAAKCWDPDTGQWWNAVNTGTSRDKYIAITP